MALRLETERLVVRDVEAADASPIAEIWADPEVTRYLGGPRDPEKVRASVLIAAADPPRLDLWTVERDGEVVGNCGLLGKEIEGREEVELVYVFATAHHGQGLATEAAAAVAGHARTVLGQQRLVALVHAENGASVRVAEKLGFHLERSVQRPGGRTLELFVSES